MQAVEAHIVWLGPIIICLKSFLIPTYPSLSYASLIIYALCSLSSSCLTLAIELLVISSWSLGRKEEGTA